LGENSVASTCLLNISREYQILGAMKASLKYCDEALRLAEHNFGSLHFYLVLAQRAQILLELGRLAEAQTDYECAIAAPFPEVKAALALLGPRLSQKGAHTPMRLEADEESLLPTWAERSEVEAEPVHFSVLENRLIQFLAESPKDRVEIIEHLYGDRLSFETKINRLKSLLGTLRKKSPHLLVCEGGRYRLAETIRPAIRKRGG
jgi:tetratricopeptide (TPR) repeat protein